MTKDEILAEMVKVAEALEKPGLTPAQIERGKTKYETLEEELADMKEAEKRAAEALKQSALERQRDCYTPDVKAVIEQTWKKLDPEGKRKR